MRAGAWGQGWRPTCPHQSTRQSTAKARVDLQVQDAVWHGAAVGLGGKIVIEDQFGHAVSLGTGVPEAPDQLLLLGIDAHDRRASSLALHVQVGAGPLGSPPPRCSFLERHDKALGSSRYAVPI